METWPDFIFPDKKGFKGKMFDEHLAAGYYRMQHLLFTTNNTSLGLDTKPLPVFWLRTPINKIIENATAKAIRKKCKDFTVKYNKAKINSRINELYNNYLSQIDFDAAESCYSYLHDSHIDNPFNAKIIQIRHGETLIAAGYFDVGKKSIAGILNFYHPSYKKYSLGKYLMLKKIDYALENNMEYYYTGYLSTETDKFDYKIFPDENALEVFLPVEKIWVPFKTMKKEKLAAYFLQNMKLEAELE